MTPDQRITRRELFSEGWKIAKGTALFVPVAAACTVIVPSQSADRSASTAPAVRTELLESALSAWKQVVQEKKVLNAGVTAQLLDYQESLDSVFAVWKVDSWQYTKKVEFKKFNLEASPIRFSGMPRDYALNYDWRQAGLVSNGQFAPFPNNWFRATDGIGCDISSAPTCTATRFVDGLIHIIYTGIPK